MRQKNNWSSFKDLQGFICLVLLVGWDPIGVLGYPGAIDEYDSYADKICELLSSGASEETLARHLYHLETERIEMTTSESLRTEIARKLVVVFRVFEEHECMKAEVHAGLETEKQSGTNSKMPLNVE